MREHRTEMWMFPGKKFGVVIMANADTEAIEIILWRILYDYFDVPNSRRVDLEKRARDWTAAKSKELETCHDRLYPAPSEKRLPRPLPLSAYTGTYDNLGYGNVTIFLQCGEDTLKDYPETTPAHPTVEKECLMRGSGPLEFEGKSFHVDLEHVSGGDYWVAWLFVDSYVPPASGLVKRPRLCIRAQFRTGSDGSVDGFAADFRQEGEDGPLVWYERRRSNNYQD